MIVGLRARIDGYFERLGDDAEVRAARESAAYLLDAVAGSDPDELSVVPESTQAQVHVVSRCIEDLRLKAGSRAFPLTPEEEVFLAHARSSVEQHHLEVEKAWRRMVATAVGTAKPNAQPVVSPASASDKHPMETAGVAKVAARPVDRVGGPARADTAAVPAPVDQRGQPCLGLAPAAIRVVRAYKEWESRRAKRRGFPAPPTVDDLVAETKLARPTVIRARGVLIADWLLEQIPGARKGTLRLTQRGLDLQLSSESKTAHS
jgi:hypothetical protein